MLSVQQGSTKYCIFSLWYDSTWDWTQDSWAIGEHILSIDGVYKEVHAFPMGFSPKVKEKFGGVLVV